MKTSGPAICDFYKKLTSCGLTFSILHMEKKPLKTNFSHNLKIWSCFRNILNYLVYCITKHRRLWSNTIFTSHEFINKACTSNPFSTVCPCQNSHSFRPTAPANQRWVHEKNKKPTNDKDHLTRNHYGRTCCCFTRNVARIKR